MANLKSYTTLYRVKARNKILISDTSQDQRILDKIHAATQEIDRICSRYFQPIIATHKFDYQDDQELLFRSQDLLSLTSVTDGQGTKNNSDLTMLGGEDTTFGPYYGLYCDPTKTFFLYLTTPIRSISVVGAWGFHDDYGNAFIDSSDTILGTPNSTTTSLTVSNVVGTDSQGNYPRFSPGQMIAVTLASSGNTEWLEVVAADSTAQLSLTGQPSDGNNFVIGLNGKTYTYTFKTNLTPTAGQVLIGTSIQDSLNNLYGAMTGKGGTAGTSYAAGTITLPTGSVDITNDPTSNILTLGYIVSSSAPTLSATGANLAVSSTTPCTTITVKRAYAGSTANNYLGGEKINTYLPPADVQDVCTRLAAFLLQQDDTSFNTTLSPEMGATFVPTAVPKDILLKLDPYVKRRVN